ncbi:spermatogenesis-associated protein 1-like isoform X2 [Neocloeon triangulifer]|uniref:spermatogenesis-associated protein 1-like isoform X2 n=1 Tax=Neocloeon triangulifer TaxID=2078957 RepID=UPI00286F09F4|nr:spermatogenesis-associated protein 1-like isoform X2 [Neocloeon triangulifer]
MSASLTDALATDRSSRRSRSADSEKGLLELHVYEVPVENWQESRQLTSSPIDKQSISLGFLRVSPEASVRRLRTEIAMQLGPQIAPDDFVFLRSVGRNYTQVKLHQEEQLRAKNFAPPYANDPEVYMIKIKSESRLETTTSFLTDSDKGRAIKGFPDDLYSLTSPQSAELNNLSTLTFPALSLTPQQGLQTVVPAIEQSPAVHTEDSGVMSEEETPSPEPYKAIALPGPKAITAAESFETEKDEEAEEEEKNKDGSEYSESAPAIVEAIPNLSKHHLFSQNDDEPVSPGPIVTIPIADKHDKFFSPNIEQKGDFSVTFVILEDDAAPKTPIQRIMDTPIELDGELEEAEEPQQFRLFQGNNSTNDDDENEDELALMRELREISIMNREEEARRHLLVGRATDLQQKLRVKKDKKQTALKSQLVAARRTQVPLEHACAQLRMELDRHLLSSLDNNKDQQVKISGLRDGPSRKSNLKMAACRLQREVKDLNRTIGSVKLRLETEIKLRAHVEMDIRNFRSELSEKKAAVAALRSSRIMPSTRTRLPTITNKA